MNHDRTLTLLGRHQYRVGYSECQCGEDYSPYADEQMAHANHLAELMEALYEALYEARKPKRDEDMVEVLLRHQFMPTHRECQCGEWAEGSAAHADHVAEELAKAGFGNFSELSANPHPHLAVAASEYHNAVKALHEDEHGNPHCALRCNKSDEMNGIKLDTRFHEDILNQYENAETRFVIEYAAAMERLDGQSIKLDSPKPRVDGSRNTFESKYHSWGIDGNCRHCGHGSHLHEIETMEERTFSLGTTTVVVDVWCNQCRDEDDE